MPYAGVLALLSPHHPGYPIILSSYHSHRLLQHLFFTCNTGNPDAGFFQDGEEGIFLDHPVKREMVSPNREQQLCSHFHNIVMTYEERVWGEKRFHVLKRDYVNTDNCCLELRFPKKLSKGICFNRGTKNNTSWVFLSFWTNADQLLRYQAKMQRNERNTHSGGLVVIIILLSAAGKSVLLPSGWWWLCCTPIWWGLCFVFGV